MSIAVRIATFNTENLDGKEGAIPSLAERVAVMRPQLIRLRADILCLQEVNGQETPDGGRTLSALGELIKGTPYEGYHMIHTTTAGGQPYDERNLVILSRFPVIAHSQIKNQILKAKLKYQKMTAIPEEGEAREVTWERPVLYATFDLGDGRTLHLVTVHRQAIDLALGHALRQRRQVQLGSAALRRKNAKEERDDRDQDQEVHKTITHPSRTHRLSSTSHSVAQCDSKGSLSLE